MTFQKGRFWESLKAGILYWLLSHLPHARAQDSLIDAVDHLNSFESKFEIEQKCKKEEKS